MLDIVLDQINSSLTKQESLSVTITSGIPKRVQDNSVTLLKLAESVG